MRPQATGKEELLRDFVGISSIGGGGGGFGVGVVVVRGMGWNRVPK